MIHLKFLVLAVSLFSVASGCNTRIFEAPIIKKYHKNDICKIMVQEENRGIFVQYPCEKDKIQKGKEKYSIGNIVKVEESLGRYSLID